MTPSLPDARYCALSAHFPRSACAVYSCFNIAWAVRRRKSTRFISGDVGQKPDRFQMCRVGAIYPILSIVVALFPGHHTPCPIETRRRRALVDKDTINDRYCLKILGSGVRNITRWEGTYAPPTKEGGRARSAIAVAREPGDVNHADGDKINQAPRRQRGNRISRTRPKRRKRGRPCITAATFGYRMRGILRANVAPPVESDPELIALSISRRGIYTETQSIPLFG